MDKKTEMIGRTEKKKKKRRGKFYSLENKENLIDEED